VVLEATGDHVGGAFVTCGLGALDGVAGRRGGDLVAFDQLGHHVFPLRHAGFFLDRGELAELAVGARGEHVEDADALGHFVGGQPEGVVLHLEHGVEAVELRARHVPMEIVRLQVQRIGVREELGQMLRDRFAVFLGDTDIDGHVATLLGFFFLGAKS